MGVEGGGGLRVCGGGGRAIGMTTGIWIGIDDEISVRGTRGGYFSHHIGLVLQVYRVNGRW